METELLVEVRPAAVSGDLRPRAVLPEEFSRRAAEIADSVVDVADLFRSRLEERVQEEASVAEDVRHWGLRQVELDFAIDLRAEAGVIIARGSAGGTFTAKLTWNRGRPG